jgi:hypothetical protein
MQLKKPFEYLQTYLDNNPDVRQTYVNWGLAAAKAAVVPINQLLKHLIEVQHLDLNGMPGISALNSPYLFKSGQMDSSAYDDDFDIERLTEIYKKIRQTPPPPPVKEYTRFVDDSAFQLDPLDRLQNLLDKLTREIVDKGLADEAYKSVSAPNVFREAAENNRDSLSLEEIKKLMGRTEELKKVKEEVSKVQEINVASHCVKPIIKSINEGVEEIQKLVIAGHLNPVDFKELITHGLDPKAVEAWKVKYGSLLQKPRPKSRIVKQVAKSRKKKPNKKPDFGGVTLRIPRR